jgi:hypothetical protein
MLYRKLRYSLFALTACSTILAGTALGFPKQQQVVSLIVVSANALAAVVMSIEGLRKPAELWILERNVFYALKDLNREIEYKIADGMTDQDADMYYGRMQGILSSSLDKWSGQVQPDKSRSPASVPASMT